VVSDCPACTKAAQRVSHEFRASCRGCCARALARSPHFRRVRDAGVQDQPYRLALQQFGLEHADVRAAAAADKASQ
jgi:hypothetical protein